MQSGSVDAYLNEMAVMDDIAPKEGGEPEICALRDFLQPLDIQFIVHDAEMIGTQQETPLKPVGGKIIHLLHRPGHYDLLVPKSTTHSSEKALGMEILRQEGQNRQLFEKTKNLQDPSKRVKKQAKTPKRIIRRAE